jgi:peptidoglycan lytic transglycosylase
LRTPNAAPLRRGARTRGRMAGVTRTGRKAFFAPGLEFVRTMAKRLRTIALASLALAACAGPFERRPPHSAEEPRPPEAPLQRDATSTAPPSTGRIMETVQVGYATWYGGKLAGRKTANGERFDPRQLTAAHRSLPFGTWVEVQRIETGATVRVRITDRGPFGHQDRIIDLSRSAAERIDMLKTGVAKVRLRVVAGP